MKLDPMNPQVASRLISSFRSWRNLEAGRRAQARAALESMAEKENLSPDLRDIVGRALA